MRTPRAAIAVASIVAIAAFGSARASTEALIALSGGSWDRDGRIHDTLSRTYGFADVRLAISAAPDEVSELVRDVVERAAAPGTRRLIWISGPDAGRDGSPCPAFPTAPWIVRAPTLVLAPRCYVDVFRFGAASRHFEVATPDRPAPGESRIGGQAPLAVIVLPGDAPRFSERADHIVLAGLEAGAWTRPADLLAALRGQFAEAGSDYTPALVVSAADVAHASDILVPRISRSIGNAEAAGRRTRPLRAFLELRRSADPATDPALRLGPAVSVVALRPNAAGTMVFVRAGGGLFGWVNANALE